MATTFTPASKSSRVTSFLYFRNLTCSKEM